MGGVMSRRFPLIEVLMFASLGGLMPSFTTAAVAQTAQDAERIATREQVRTFLAAAGPRNDVNIPFHQSDKNPWNFVGIARGLTNSDYLEIVVQVGDKNTLAVVVYPHFMNSYINIGRAADPAGLMHKLLNLNDHNFFYWGADDENDVFACYSFTLESGFPDKSLLVALTSIRAQDQFIAVMRPFIVKNDK